MLNSETDAKMLSNIHDTLISMLHELVMENLAGWLTLCKAVLSASTGTIQTGPFPTIIKSKKKILNALGKQIRQPIRGGTCKHYM